MLKIESRNRLMVLIGWIVLHVHLHVLTSLTSDHQLLIQTNSHEVNARPRPKKNRTLFSVLSK